MKWLSDDEIEKGVCGIAGLGLIPDQAKEANRLWEENDELKEMHAMVQLALADTKTELNRLREGLEALGTELESTIEEYETGITTGLSPEIDKIKMSTAQSASAVFLYKLRRLLEVE